MGRPSFLANRHDPFAIADRAAWQELDLEEFSHIPFVGRLAAILRPVNEPSQLVHGDLTGNVLFHPTLAPAIIDFSPYWRPAPFASAVVVVDAVTWEGGDPSLIRLIGPQPAQYLVRALIFRLVMHELCQIGNVAPVWEPFGQCVDLAVRHHRRRSPTGPAEPDSPVPR